jgi:dTDP-4-amino-4,6-dideoxygalactose transaminase
MNRLLSLASAPLRLRGEDPLALYEGALRERLGVPDVVLTWMGRTGLHAVGRAIGLGPGDEVVLTAYSCVVVTRAFSILGARPVYVDIDPATYNMPVEGVLRAIGPRTRLVILQHTYGHPMPVEPVLAYCRPRGITVIEDACHAFGATVDGRPAGTVADAGFFSTQWNKPFSTGFGGFLAIPNADLARRVRSVLREAVVPSRSLALQLRAQLLVHEAVVTPRTHGLAQRTYQWLYSRGLILGSGTPEEAAGVAFRRVPDEYFQRMSVPQAEAGLFEAGRFDAGFARRRVVMRVYADGLRGMGLPPAAEGPGTLYSRYPLRVRNKAEVVREAMLAGVPIGSWFETPLHPIPLARHGDFGMDVDRFPCAMAAAREVINLPVGRATRDEDAARALRFVAERGRQA